jgi:hypothetical protein
MRTLSLQFREAMHAQQTDVVPIVLLLIEHPDLDEPVRLSSDPTVRLQESPLLYGTVAQGETWTFLPFSLVWPEEKDEGAPVQKLQIDNIDRELIRLLRSTISPALVQAFIVLSSAPDVIEIEGAPFDLTMADYDARSISMTLNIDALAFEPFPAGGFTPAAFPGLF